MIPLKYPLVRSSLQNIKSLILCFKASRVIGASVVIVAGVIAATVFFFFQPREFHVILAPEAIPPDELSRVAGLLQKIERLKNWRPLEASDANLELLVKHLRANPRAQSWQELKRSGSEPQIGLLNRALGVLAEKWPDRQPPQVANLSDKLLRNQLQSVLVDAGRGSCQEAIQRLLQSAEFERAVAPAVYPPCPPPSYGWMKWIHDHIGWSLDERERWTSAVLAAIQTHRQRIEELYRLHEQTRRFSEAVLARAGSYELVATRIRYNDLSTQPIVWRNGAAAVDVTLMLRSDEGGAGPAVLRDAGIRLLELPLGVDSHGQLQPGWPPVTAVVADEPFRAYLRGGGFPNGLLIDSVQVEVSRSSSHPILRAAYRVQSEDFPGWSAEQSVEVWNNGPALDSVAEAGQAALESLRQFVASSSIISGVAVRVRPGENDSLRVRLTDPKLPEVELGLAIAPNGRPLWLGPVSLADLERITDWLVDQNPHLAPYRPILLVEAVELDRSGKLSGRLVLPSASIYDSPAPVPVRVSWQTWGDQPLIAPLPPGVAPPPPPAPEPLHDLDVSAVMRHEIRNRFPLISDKTEVIRVGNTWVIGLQIADWPLLRLGPVTPVNVLDISHVVEELLSPEVVMAVARTQWWCDDRGVYHPKFGSTNPTIIRWAPKLGEAEIECQAPLWDEYNRKAEREKRLYLTWSETYRILDGAWRRFDDIPVLKAEEKAREQLHMINNAASLYFGIPLTLEPDLDEKTGRFVCLSPPSLRLKTRVQLPLLIGSPEVQNLGELSTENWKMLGVEVNRITLDVDGLHPPEEVQFTYPNTFVTPFRFAISDPRLGLRRTREGYELFLGAKITPALIPGLPAGPSVAVAYGLADVTTNVRLDNPWLHLLYLDVEGSARLDTPEFHLLGYVSYLEKNEVARGHLTLILPGSSTPPRLTGRIQAGSANVISGLPLQLEGNLNVDGDGIDITGKLDLISSLRAAVGFRFGIGDKARSLSESYPPPEIALRSRLVIFGALVTLGGWSRLDFSDYYLYGEAIAVVDFLIDSRTVGIQVTLTPNGVQVNFIWESGGKTIQESFSAPSLDDVDWEKLKELIHQADKKAQAYPPPEPGEHETYLCPSRQTQPVQLEHASILDDDEQQPTRGRIGGTYYNRVVKLIPTDHPVDSENPSFLIFKYFRDEQSAIRAQRGEGVSNLLDGLILHKKEVGLDHIRRVRGYEFDKNGWPLVFRERADAYKCSYALWPKVETDPETNLTRCVGGKLLITDHVKKRVLFISAHEQVIQTVDGRKNYEVFDLTDHFKDVKPLYETEGTREEDTDRLIFNQKMIRRYADMYARGMMPITPPRPKADGYSFQFSGDGNTALEGEHEVFIWREGQGPGMLIRRVFLYGPGVSAEQRTESLYEQLKTLGIDSLHWVVTVVPGVKPHFVLMSWDEHSGVPVLRLKPKDRGIPVMPLDAPLGRQLEAAHKAAELVWRLAIPGTELRGVFFGFRGLTLSTHRGLWLVPSGNVNARPEGSSGIWFVSWERLRKWSSPTVAHLPEEWKSPDQRIAWVEDPQLLLRAALSDWEAERTGQVPGVTPDEARHLRDQANRWAADPLGLLMGLGEEWAASRSRDGTRNTP